MVVTLVPTHNNEFDWKLERILKFYYNPAW